MIMVSVFVSKQRCFLLLKRRLIPVQKIAIMTEKIHVGQKAWEFDTKITAVIVHVLQ